MAHKKRSSNPRRGTRRGPRGWIKRHGKWVKGALARGGRKARSARRGKARSSKRTARKSARKSRRSSKHSYRRNPGAGQLRDGTMVSINGNSVTLTTEYGENYEFDEVSKSGIYALASAKNFKAAQRACNRSGILRSINPKRRGRKSRR